MLNNCVRVLQTSRSPLTTISTNTVHLRRHAHAHTRSTRARTPCTRARKLRCCAYSGTLTRSSHTTLACQNFCVRIFRNTHTHTHTADKQRSAERLDQREGGTQFTCFTSKKVDVLLTTIPSTRCLALQFLPEFLSSFSQSHRSVHYLSLATPHQSAPLSCTS